MLFSRYMSPLYAGLDEGEPTVLIQMVNEDTGNEWCVVALVS
jgi:hypothetical protein